MSKKPIAPATALEPNDGLTFLRFGKLAARARELAAVADNMAAQSQATRQQAEQLAAQADALMVPVRKKYTLGDHDQVDDTTFAIRRVKAK